MIRIVIDIYVTLKKRTYKNSALKLLQITFRNIITNRKSYLFNLFYDVFYNQKRAVKSIKYYFNIITQTKKFTFIIHFITLLKNDIYKSQNHKLNYCYDL